jgi:hypothetical protein
VQSWLDRYLKHKASAPGPLLAKSFRYLEPAGKGRWASVALDRARQLSFYYCSGYSMHDPATGRLVADGDVGGVGGCPKLSSESARGCLNVAGGVSGKRLGRAVIGRTRKRQRQVLGGRLLSRRGGIDRYCVNGGGAMRIGYPTARLRRAYPGRSRVLLRRRRRALLVLTSSKRVSVRGLGVGDSLRTLHRRLRGERRLPVGRNSWYVASGRRARLLFQVRRGRIRQVGIADKGLTRGRRAGRSFLRAWQLGS